MSTSVTPSPSSIKQRARLFTVFLGEIEERASFQEELLPARTDQGGLSQAGYQRHHEAHVHWHLKRVVQRLASCTAGGLSSA
jgi:hypothetical protein